MGFQPVTLLEGFNSVSFSPENIEIKREKERMFLIWLRKYFMFYALFTQRVFCIVIHNSYSPPAGRSCMTLRQAEKIFPMRSKHCSIEAKN
jgi:hypothetical protein